MASPSIVDYTRPLIWQVGYLGQDYWSWVHKPLPKWSGRHLLLLSKYRLIESFTFMPWYGPLLCWLPVVHCLGIYAPTDFGIVPWHWLGGLLAWPLLMEYGLHRFIFHRQTSGWLGNTLHFCMHGIHHKDPYDELRLVAPLTLSVPIYWLFYILLTNMPFIHANAVVAGLICGYLVYDELHYWQHHGNLWMLRKLKRHHMAHHFVQPDRKFGVSTDLTDRLYGSQ